jgi:hypothetical protein
MSTVNKGATILLLGGGPGFNPAWMGRNTADRWKYIFLFELLEVDS